MTCGFCKENSFFHKYISGSIHNAHVVQWIFTAPSIGVTPLKLDRQPQTNALFDNFEKWSIF